MGTFLNIFKVSHNQMLYFFNIKNDHLLPISEKRGTFALLSAVN